MQGDHLEMIADGIGILPPNKNLKQDITDVTQPWYADNAGDLGTFAKLATYFDLLTRLGPGQGYFTKLSKSVLIVRLDNIKAGKYFGAHHRFKVCTCAHYLGGYIGDDKSKRDWMR